MRVAVCADCTHRIIDIWIAQSSQILDEAGHLLRTPEKCDSLVDDVRPEIIYLPRTRDICLFPIAFQDCAISVIAEHEISQQTLFIVKSILTETQAQWGRLDGQMM